MGKVDTGKKYGGNARDVGIGPQTGITYVEGRGGHASVDSTMWHGTRSAEVQEDWDVKDGGRKGRTRENGGHARSVDIGAQTGMNNAEEREKMDVRNKGKKGRRWGSEKRAGKKRTEQGVGTQEQERETQKKRRMRDGDVITVSRKVKRRAKVAGTRSRMGRYI